MTEIPNPAQLAEQHQAARERDLERARVKTVRSRRRVREGKLAQRMDEQTAIALSKLAHPDVRDEGAAR